MSDQAHSLTSTLFDDTLGRFQSFLTPKSKFTSSHTKHMNLAHTTNKKNSQNDKWAKSQCLLLFSMRSPYLIVHGTHIVNIVFKIIVHSWFNAYNTQDLQLKSNIILQPGNAKFINGARFATCSIFYCNVSSVITSSQLSNYGHEWLFYSPLTKNSKISNEIFEPRANSFTSDPQTLQTPYIIAN